MQTGEAVENIIVTLGNSNKKRSRPKSSSSSSIIIEANNSSTTTYDDDDNRQNKLFKVYKEVEEEDDNDEHTTSTLKRKHASSQNDIASNKLLKTSSDDNNDRNENAVDVLIHSVHNNILSSDERTNHENDPEKKAGLSPSKEEQTNNVHIVTSSSAGIASSACSNGTNNHKTLSTSTVSTTFEPDQTQYQQHGRIIFTNDYVVEKKQTLTNNESVTTHIITADKTDDNDDYYNVNPSARHDHNNSNSSLHHRNKGTYNGKGPSNIQIMSLLAVLFLVNIGTTFSILSIIFKSNSYNRFFNINPFTQSLSNKPKSSSISPLSSSTSTIAKTFQRHHPHVIPPRYILNKFNDNKNQNITIQDHISNITLRQFFADERGFHLGLAPAFFGFYVYYGTLAALHENVLSEEQIEAGMRLIPQNSDIGNIVSEVSYPTTTTLLKSVAGASAGAMAAVQLASGLSPRKCGIRASSLTLDKFADPPGFGGIFKGDLFEEIMAGILRETKTKILQQQSNHTLKNNVYKEEDTDGLHENVLNFQLEDGLIPVAVTAFDLLKLQTKTLTKGCAAKAARASATFPVLFQPVKWPEEVVDVQHGVKDTDETNNDDDEHNNHISFISKLKKILPHHIFIDGGVLDPFGLVGLASLLPQEKNKRIVNLVAGSFSGRGGSISPPGPSRMPDGLLGGENNNGGEGRVVREVLSISVENTPRCGPDKMQNGPHAVNAAIDAVKAVMDAKLYYGEEENHYILHIDASAFVPPEIH